jgi:hypothetical protein
MGLGGIEEGWVKGVGIVEWNDGGSEIYVEGMGGDDEKGLKVVGRYRLTNRLSQSGLRG